MLLAETSNVVPVLQSPVKSLRPCASRRCSTSTSSWRSFTEERLPQQTAGVSPRTRTFTSLLCRAAPTLDEEAIKEVTEKHGVPTPIVKIDNKVDNWATVLSVGFGNELGELLDTTLALKNLGLNIRRAKIRPGDSGKLHKFYITDAHTAEKVTKSARLEEIRMVVLQNLLYYHPESATELGFGPSAAKTSSRDSLHPLGPRARSEIKTNISVKEDPDGAYTEVVIKTTDRPGLLTDIVTNMKDMNVNVVSAEVDTEGPLAIDQFYVTYHGDPLPPPMITLLTNSLQYQLALAEVSKEESY